MILIYIKYVIFPNIYPPNIRLKIIIANNIKSPFMDIYK